MHKWSVRDRDGHEIYLTKEQWEHIVSGHSELRHHLDEILNTVRRGRRRQQPHDPQTYVYRLPCDNLRSPLNGILVVVAFRFEQQENAGMIPNNFIVTAWGIMMRR
ncbi:MAG: hypothetical protein U0401_15070 [Anaerolineae bacterium]